MEKEFSNVKLIRRRHIPDEVNILDKDRILAFKDDIIITGWDCIHARKDICSGYSMYFLKKGYKVSKMLDSGGRLVRWYCDIVMPHVQDNVYEFEDLLLDVVIDADGGVVVMDADEFAKAIEEGMIDKERTVYALRALNELLGLIYSGDFQKIKEQLDFFDNRAYNSDLGALF